MCEACNNVIVEVSIMNHFLNQPGGWVGEAATNGVVGGWVNE